MTIPTTPTPTSGVSFSQIRAEIRAGTNDPTAVPGAIPINNAQIRKFAFNAGPLTVAQAKPIANTRGVTFAPLSISADTTSYNVRQAMAAAGWDITYRAIANLQVGAVTVGAPAVTGAAITTTNNPWPSTSELYITIASGAVIHGKGGPGGAGGSAVGPVTPSAQWAAGQIGTGGGTAILIGTFGPLTTIINNGVISGGGGGGGGGNGRRVFPAVSGGGGGGGGRSGQNTPLGGAGGTSTPATPTGVPQPGQAGQGGSSTQFGTGGQNTPQPAPTRAGIGGNGGGRGAAGQPGGQGGLPGTQGPGAGSGGAAGFSIDGYFLNVTSYSGTGQLLGPTV